MGLFDAKLLQKLLGEDIVKKAEGEFNEIKEEWNNRHIRIAKDHKAIGELLGEILKKLDEIKEQNEKK